MIPRRFLQPLLPFLAVPLLAMGHGPPPSAVLDVGPPPGRPQPGTADGIAAPLTAERYRQKVSGSTVDRGGAKIPVKATADVVSAVVQDYGNYSVYFKQFRKSEVVRSRGGFTDVRLEAPILGGFAKLWAVVRFGPPETVGETEKPGGGARVIRGKFLKGNLKNLEVTWRIHPLGNGSTRLHLELHMVPKIPIPKSVVSSELESAAAKGVTAARDRAERVARSSANK